MERHSREEFFIVGEGVIGEEPAAPSLTDGALDDGAGPDGATHDGATGEPKATLRAAAADEPLFRFSRIGPKGTAVGLPLRRALATAMTKAGGQRDSGIPSGFTYLGQFIDHDLTFDPSPLKPGTVPLAQLEQRRSPSLDLDSLYGLGPVATPEFYQADGIRLRTGATDLLPGESPPPGVANTFDLPRSTTQKHAVIPDPRNDENLVVGQTHLAFVKFHNQVVKRLADSGVPSSVLFERAREEVTRHYQWMIMTDFLPQIVRPSIVETVFRNGRRIFEVGAAAGTTPTMPVEFSVACYRLGHSMVRPSYDWNRVFDDGGGSLGLLFNFSGTSGFLGEGNVLPSNWIADFRRLYDFGVTGRNDLEPFVDGRVKLNFARRIDSLLTHPLADLPPGAVSDAKPTAEQLNLAFRNLDRARMLELATGQQLVKVLNDKGVHVQALTRKQILEGDGGAVLTALSDVQKDRLVANTPLWFYILREAEVHEAKLVGVGGRIVAETFHRAIEGSRTSILGAGWHPTLGPDANTFRMVDLLLVAFEGAANQLNPLGDPT